MAPRLEIVIGARDDASRHIETVDSALGKLGETAGAAGKAIAAGMAAAGAAVVAGLGASVKVAADFEQSLANTRAATGATATGMAALREEALGIGRDTSKSASEAAAAMGELTKAGVPLETVIAGAARSVVQLAEATGSDVAEMSVLTANAMNTFRDSALTTVEATNLIAKTANASAINTTEFRMALQAVGPVASTMGFDFEDLAAAIGVMGNNALRSSDAGTSLKTMLMNLIPETKEQRILFRQLGLQVDDTTRMMELLRTNGVTPLGTDSATLRAQLQMMAGEIGAVDLKAKDAAAQFEKWLFRNQALQNGFFDARGELKPLADVAGLLNDKLKDMTSEQQISYLGKLFGQDAVRAAAILMNEGADGVARFIKEMKAAPDVAEQSRIRLDTLQGTMEKIKGSLEVVAIEIGTRMLPVIRELAEVALKAINGDFKGAWDDAVKFVREAIPKVMDAAKTLGNELRDWIAATRPLIEAKLAEWKDAFAAWVPGAWSALVAQAGALRDRFTDWIADTALPGIKAKLGEWRDAFAAWVPGAWNALLAEAGALRDRFTAWIADVAPVIKAKLAEWKDAFAAWVPGAWSALRAEAETLQIRFTTWIADVVPGIKAKLTEWKDAFAAWVPGAWAALVAQAETLRDRFTTWIADVVPRIQAQIGEWKAAFHNWVGPAWDSLLQNLTALKTSFEAWLRDTALPAIETQLEAWRAATVDWANDVWADLQPKLVTLKTSLETWAKDPATQKGIEDAFLTWKAASVKWTVAAADEIDEEATKISDAFETWAENEGAAAISATVREHFPKAIALGLAAGNPGKLIAEANALGYQAAMTEFFAPSGEFIKGWGKIMSNLLDPLEATLGPGLRVIFKRIWDDFIAGLGLPGGVGTGGGSGFPGGGGGSTGGGGGSTGGGGGSTGGGLSDTLKAAFKGATNTVYAGMASKEARSLIQNLIGSSSAAGATSLVTALGSLLAGLPSGPLVSTDVSNIIGALMDMWRAAGGAAFGSGGIVTRPTLALVGERGPEAIVPLGAGMGGYHFHFHGAVSAERDVQDMVIRAMVGLERSGRLRAGTTA